MTRRRSVTLTRRDLLGAAAAGSAATAATTIAGDAHAFRLLAPEEAPAPDASVPSFCELCFWNCGLLAEVKNDRVLALRGHPLHPSSQGKLCGRGNAGAAFITDRDRLRYPMVRVGERGEGRFRRVGWNTAYETIARGMKGIIDAHGARALALFYHGTGGPMMRALHVALGSPNFAAPSYAQCKGPREVGYKLTFGEKLGSPEPLDYDRTQCMVLFGSHLGENAHNSQVQEFVRARARGAKLIVLDPRFSTVAARADVWLAVRPGSDTAILLAWIRQLLQDEAYDAEFVTQHTTGLAELRHAVAPYTMAWAAAQASVPEAAVRQAYELMVAARPSVIVHPGRHVSWYGEADTQRARAQAILTALLGAWWRPGGVFRPSPPPSVKDFPGPDFPELPPSVDSAAGRFPFAQEVTTNGIRDATRSGAPYPIKGWFVHGTNLLQSLPNVHETEDAIQKLDLLVVCDIQPTEITRYADVLLPEDTYLERYDDLKVSGGRQPFIALRQPVVPPRHDTRPAWRIARDLARHLGVGDYFAFETFEEYLATRLDGTGVTLEELKRDGIRRFEATVPPYLAPGEEVHWHTPSGKIELFSPGLAKAGFAAVPTYSPQPLPTEGWLRMLYGRSPLHTFGRTQNNEILFDLDPSNCVWLHPDSARALGVGNRQPVFLENDHGDRTGPVIARVTERAQPGTLYLVHGFGHRAPGMRHTNRVGASDTDVLDHYAVDPISGSTGMRVQLVKVSPAALSSEVFPCARR
jgi:thiosulfate reductase/polysulfide reductase chain A